MPHSSVYAIAVSEGQALQIENHLTKAGFSNDDISALIPDKDSNVPLVHVQKSAAAGGTSGGVFSGALDLLAGIGALAIPGVGRLIAVGPLLSALSGVAAGAVVGISGALVALGISAKEAAHFEDRIAGGDILISVHAETADEVSKAREVLEQMLAEDISVASI